MLYKALVKLVQNQGLTEELRGRIDVLFAAGKLTEEQYQTLIGMAE